MVSAGCVFVAGIHPSKTWMSGSFEFVRLNACVHRLDLDLYSYSKEFWGNGVRNHVNSKGKIPCTGGSEEVWTHDAASHRSASPTHYLLCYSGPRKPTWKVELLQDINVGITFLDFLLNTVLMYSSLANLAQGRLLHGSTPCVQVLQSLSSLGSWQLSWRNVMWLPK